MAIALLALILMWVENFRLHSRPACLTSIVVFKSLLTKKKLILEFENYNGDDQIINKIYGNRIENLKEIKFL
ncbi:hypothetical protein BpHYR1_015154, partial [Brachionus plicatilis]